MNRASDRAVAQLKKIQKLSADFMKRLKLVANHQLVGRQFPRGIIPS